MDHQSFTDSATNPLKNGKNTTCIGRLAEAYVAKQLERSGYIILERNWRRRDVELDIIALKQNVLYVIEVKYRKSSFVTIDEVVQPHKIRQLNWGARCYLHQRGQRAKYRLIAILVVGEPMYIKSVIDVSSVQ